MTGSLLFIVGLLFLPVSFATTLLFCGLGVALYQDNGWDDIAIAALFILAVASVLLVLAVET